MEADPSLPDWGGRSVSPPTAGRGRAAIQSRMKSVAHRLANLEAGPIWWYEYFNQKMPSLTRPKLVELGAPKMKGQFLISAPMSHFNKENLF